MNDFLLLFLVLLNFFSLALSIHEFVRFGTDPLADLVGRALSPSSNKSWHGEQQPVMCNVCCNVMDYGAVGDGETDDTQAFQKTFDDCSSTEGGLITIPSGYFLISSQITLTKNAPALSISGNGWQSIILWKGNEDLFVWANDAVTTHLTISDFAIVSVDDVKDSSNFAFRFPAGLTQSVARQILFYGSGGNITNHAVTLIPGAFHLGDVTDTVTITDCVVWFGFGTLIRIGYGSEVRVQGGRYIGTNDREQGMQGIGIHVTGNNGGVHVVDSDVIGLNEGKLRTIFP